MKYFDDINYGEDEYDEWIEMVPDPEEDGSVEKESIEELLGRLLGRMLS